MNQHSFYAHLVKLDRLEAHLARFDLEESHYKELMQIAHQTVHVEVVNTVLANLPQEDHGKFLKHLDQKPEDEGLMVFLKRSVSDIEKKIKQAVTQIEEKLIDELYDYEEAAEEWLSGE